MLSAQTSRALVHNAADGNQVRRAGRVEKRRQARLAVALKAVMASPEGRLVFWELLTSAGVYRSVWRMSAEIHYLAGRQDFGHEIMADLIAVDDEAYQRMEREMRALAKREDSENEAAHTPRAEEQEQVAT